MDANELLAMFEKQAMLRPESPTASILVDVYEEYRKEIDARAFGIQAMNAGMLADNNAQYRYALAKYRTDERGQRYYTDTYRLTEVELKELAMNNNLEYSKLFSVAIGDRLMYKGYIQGEFIRFTYGKMYGVAVDKPVPETEKQGAWGLFRQG